MREVYKTVQPIPRAGLPEDIAQAAVFLASDEVKLHQRARSWWSMAPSPAAATGRSSSRGYVALRKTFDQNK